MNVLLAPFNPWTNFNSAGVKPSLAEPATAVPTSAPVVSAVVAGVNSVSDGGLRTSLPSGEMEPSVMLVSPPSDSCCGGKVNPMYASATSGSVKSGVATGQQDSIPESASSNPCPDKIDADTSEGAASFPASTDFTGTQYIPELFSVFAARRCLPIVSPPLPYSAIQIRNRFPLHAEAIMSALEDELADEQRTINDAILLRQFAPEPEDPPLFLRGPLSAAFAPAPTRSIVDSLLKVAGVRS